MIKYAFAQGGCNFALANAPITPRGMQKSAAAVGGDEFAAQPGQAESGTIFGSESDDHGSCSVEAFLHAPDSTFARHRAARIQS
jgi:hypothetical protein